MKLNLKIWRQGAKDSDGKFVDYPIDDVNPDMSFLEMLDVVNIRLVAKGETAIEFDHDCREGICGSCSLTINGQPHGPDTGTATCQLHMRRFEDGQTIVVEPWRAKAFPVLRDLMVDRSAFDRIIAAGGFVSVNTGTAPDGNAVAIPKDICESSMDSAACIGCGACVAACKNASAMLFVGAKVTHLALLPQGQPERRRRVRAMVAQMDEEGFGSCSNTGACEAACPKEISLENIAKLNRELLAASLCD
ncbi:MAG: succinate dehydrogenase/fumarate reductase iron-sulfur subunit [Deltaproteobacteria bacterium]|nr:succinate dehydrogenase/fumarate reductase iron-sulfur subunit [Deltaproteobacteria bacterium]MBI3293414.1 succinate dehydrogenase/fumarate reductase iron-sulfur subunit [Deltaproteobacteria bacterium]